MCYSILVQQDLKILERQFGAAPIRTQFEHYEKIIFGFPKNILTELRFKNKVNF